MTGWIGGRSFDLTFFFGSGLLAVALGALAIAAPGTVASLWWLWLWLVDGPHLLATWSRTYLDQSERVRRRRLLLGSLLLLLPGPLCVLASHATGIPAFFEGFLAVMVLASWHHTVRQHYGVMALYETLRKADPSARRLDGLFLHGSLWTLFGLFLLGHPSNRLAMGLPPVLPPLVVMASTVATGLLVLVCLWYAGVVALRWRRGQPVVPGLFVLVQAAATTAFAFFLVGRFEPLLPAPTDPEQHFLAVAVVIGTIHGMQYLGIVFAANRRRYAQSKTPTIASRLGSRPLLAYILFVVFSAIYLILNGARGVGPGFTLFTPGTLAAQLFLALYWGLFMHHYYLDQEIWHPRRDPALRAELGLAG